MIYARLPGQKSDYSKAAQTGVSFTGGYLAGILCAIVSHPADVMVSKLNANRQAGEAFGAALGRIYKDIGFSGLWNGLPVRIFMIGTLTGLQWMIYVSFILVLVVEWRGCLGGCTDLFRRITSRFSWVCLLLVVLLHRRRSRERERGREVGTYRNEGWKNGEERQRWSYGTENVSVIVLSICSSVLLNYTHVLIYSCQNDSIQLLFDRMSMMFLLARNTEVTCFGVTWKVSRGTFVDVRSIYN